MSLRGMPLSRAQAWSVDRRSGFSIIEAVMVLLIVVVVVGALTPAVVRQITHARVNRAANVVAADFFLCQALAGRQHSPVTLALDSVAMTSTITNPFPTSTTLFTRHFGKDSEFKLSVLRSSVAGVQILPNGMVNASVTITIGDGSYTRQVRMTRAGQVRVL